MGISADACLQMKMWPWQWTKAQTSYSLSAEREAAEERINGDDKHEIERVSQVGQPVPGATDC